MQAEAKHPHNCLGHTGMMIIFAFCEAEPGDTAVRSGVRRTFFPCIEVYGFILALIIS